MVERPGKGGLSPKEGLLRGHPWSRVTAYLVQNPSPSRKGDDQQGDLQQDNDGLRGGFQD